MTVEFSQLQYAVTELEYEKICNKEISVESISPRKIVGRITKSFEDIPIPRIGESISDSYWPSDFTEQKVVDVLYEYWNNRCYVSLAPFFMPEGCPLHKELERIASLHEWEYHKS